MDPFFLSFEGVVPEGTYELCSRTQRYPVSAGKLSDFAGWPVIHIADVSKTLSSSLVSL